MPDDVAVAGGRPVPYLSLAERVAWLAVAGASVVPSLWGLRFSYLNHDAAWYLHMARTWTAGGELYRDVLDTNPPLIVFLSAPAAWFATVTGAPASVWMKTWVIALAALSAAASVSAIRHIWQTRAAQVVVGSVVFLTLFSLPGGHFAQREHLALILTMPYLLHGCGRGRGSIPTVPAIALGIAAGLGFAIKPHFLIAWAAFEAALARDRGRQAWRRPELLVAAMTVVVYGGAVLVLTPAYVSMARDASEVYGALDRPFADIFYKREVLLWLVLTFCAIAVRLQRDRLRVLRLLVVTATGFFAAMVAQRKGWDYHVLPMRAWLLISAAGLIAGLADSYVHASWTRQARRAAAVTAALAIGIWGTRSAINTQRRADDELVAKIVQIVDARGGTKSVAVLSMRHLLYPAVPAALYLEAEWITRHNSFWYLPGLYAGVPRLPQRPLAFRRLEEMGTLERKYFEQTIEDLCDGVPQLLLLEPPDPSLPGGGDSIDLERYFSQDPRFVRWFAAYERFARVERFELLTPAVTPSCN